MLDSKRQIKHCLILIIWSTIVSGNGMLLEPPSRSSMWRVKWKDPQLFPHRSQIQNNYNDMVINCGGRQVLVDNDGKCGVCGDPVTDRIKENEAGGKYGLGIIARNYSVGQTIQAKVKITNNQKGYFEFRLCVWNDVARPITHECLNQNILTINQHSTKWYLPEFPELGWKIHNLNLKLPEHVVCNQCVLQWKYRTGNSWGVENGKQGFGLGQQQEYYGCSDIAISYVNNSSKEKMKSSFTEQPANINFKVSSSSNIFLINQQQISIKQHQTTVKKTVRLQMTEDEANNSIPKLVTKKVLDSLESTPPTFSLTTPTSVRTSYNHQLATIFPALSITTQAEAPTVIATTTNQSLDRNTPIFASVAMQLTVDQANESSEIQPQPPLSLNEIENISFGSVSDFATVEINSSTQNQFIEALQDVVSDAENNDLNEEVTVIDNQKTNIGNPKTENMFSSTKSTLQRRYQGRNIRGERLRLVPSRIHRSSRRRKLSSYIKQEGIASSSSNSVFKGTNVMTTCKILTFLLVLKIVDLTNLFH